YWHETNRAEKLLGDVASSNVKREDLLIIEGESFPVSFDGERIADTFKGVTAENNREMQVMKWGNGKVIWSPLPVELNQRSEPIKALYNYGLTALFPAILAGVSLLGVFGRGEQTVDAVMLMLTEAAPPEVLDPVRAPVESLVTTPAAGAALVVGLVVAVWTASRYVSALGRAMNTIYGVDEGRPIWVHKPAEVLLTALLVVFVVIGGLALVFTGPIAETV